MIKNKKVYGIIPARGGSKGIKRKNLRKLGSKSLLYWAIYNAKKSKFIDEIIVSSDSKEILLEAKKNNTSLHKRPKILSSDNSLVVNTLRNIYENLRKIDEKPIFVLLEPTSPFRNYKIIDKCIKRLINENLDSIATFNETKSNPERMWKINGSKPEHLNGKKIIWKQRQNLNKFYELNGLVYCYFPKKLPDKVPNILFGKMGAEIVSKEYIIDIDSPQDLFIANAIFKSRKFSFN